MREYPLYPVDFYDDFKAYTEGIGKKFSDATAVCSYNADGEYSEHTYAQLLGDVRAAAQMILSLGHKKEHIALLSENSYQYLVAFLGITYSGNTAVLIDPEQPPELVNELISFADCSFIIISQNSADFLLGDMQPEIPYIKMTPDGVPSDPFIEKGQKLIEDGAHDYADASPSPDDIAAIVYTSGTTHTAKAVMLSHYALLHNASESVSLVYIPRRVFVSLPFFHTYGMTCGILNSLVNGALICVNGDIKSMQHDIIHFDPETILAVPLIAEFVYKMLMNRIDEVCDAEKLLSPRKGLFGTLKPIKCAVAKKEKLFPSLKLIIAGGAHLSEKVATVLSRFGILVLQGYGITECAPLIAVNRNNLNILGSVGFPLPGYEIRIDDGVIKVKGKMLMTGYYKHPELTAEAICDGWFDTGDIGCFGKHGELYIKGRSKTIIVLKNGKKVSPEELEVLFEDVPLAKEVVAHGSAVGADIDDVLPAVTIYPDPTLCADLNSYEILDKLQQEVNRINGKLPPYKQIRVINIRETEFEKTGTKKIKRT
ncbi:MAG TPA: AMP-binding protein [Bacillota bacterium]|nr:AMP-binding protein [Bacillota bacterium]